MKQFRLQGIPISDFSRKLMKATEEELSQEVEVTKQILFSAKL